VIKRQRLLPIHHFVFWSSILFISILFAQGPVTKEAAAYEQKLTWKVKANQMNLLYTEKKQEDSSPFSFAMEADRGADDTYSRSSGLNVCTFPIEHAGLGSEAELRGFTHWQKVQTCPPLSTNIYISKNFITPGSFTASRLTEYLETDILNSMIDLNFQMKTLANIKIGFSLQCYRISFPNWSKENPHADKPLLQKLQSQMYAR
jgi:hypothetical protein